MKEWLKTVGTGLLGAVIGILVTHYANLYSEKAKSRHEIAMASIRVDQAPSAEHIDFQQLFGEMQNLSTFSEHSIKELASLKRKFPQCGDNLSDECRPFFVEFIIVMRKELGAGKASKKDIDTILKPKYDKAREALSKL